MQRGGGGGALLLWSAQPKKAHEHFSMCARYYMQCVEDFTLTFSRALAITPLIRIGARSEEAAKEVKDVEEKMKGPEREHKEADKLRADYKSEEKKLSKLRGELDETPAHKDGGNSYSKDRAALKKLVDGGGSSSSSSDAEAQYDQLEASDEAKERKAAKLSGHWGSGSSSSSSLGSDAAKRARIIKSSQSTFLTGLLSPNSPWDKKDAGS